MTEYAAVFKFDSAAEDEDHIALCKDVQPPVIYYKISKSYFKRAEGQGGQGDPVWEHCEGRPVFKLNDDRLTFYFLDTGQQVAQIGAVLEFAQEIGPFDDEVAAEIRMAGPRSTKFLTVGHEWQDAFELGPEGGYAFENTGRYSYTVTLITFPDLRKYWHDPEMDVEP